MKDKAPIKKTGEILDVESKYTINHMSFTFEYDLGDIFHTEYFLLSDGKTGWIFRRRLSTM